jgi:ribonuclease H / adenosylcobalamin/alpha-ribazole phosphatase
LVEGAEFSRTIGPVPDPHSAEYQALLAGLELAKGHTIDYIVVFSDSRTLVNQVNGLWKSKDHLARYEKQARVALKSFKGWQVSWIPREMNRDADALVDDALASAEPVEHALD